MYCVHIGKETVYFKVYFTQTVKMKIDCSNGKRAMNKPPHRRRNLDLIVAGDKTETMHYGSLSNIQQL